MTLTAELLGETSPYIYNLVYDVDVRLLFIECLDDPSDEEPSLRIVFPEVISYAESNQPDALDDELMDDLVSMDWSNENQVTILTCKKEIVLELTGKPFTEQIS
ncbi:hypothetical protein [Porticoccus sp.]|uniref:hypothetical protein n=1 Tax=Porticoccus sp. TaxID=2024853 RepID=UPI000C3EC2DD|nr:hypothetical protein [Porticoccus sp.]MAZ69569.1 hypothetical protein [Porticoccus sp.]|tara:strand:+ start:5682 stop:5993 length:312 start_codon:yes stop_codon:yes gene_type:complete